MREEYFSYDKLDSRRSNVACIISLSYIKLEYMFHGTDTFYTDVKQYIYDV